MTGLIWMVQLLAYPVFRHLKDTELTRYHEIHTRRITFLVGPAMAVEALTAVALVYQSHIQAQMNLWLWLNLVGIGLTWLSTAALSIPIHNRLQLEANQSDVERLISTNWPRTIIWSARLLLLLILS